MFDLTFHMTTADKGVIKILKIDRALYGANDRTKTYRYYGRNPDWRDLSNEENQRNKKHLNGYTRIFPDGRRKIFTYQGVTKWNYTKSKPCRTCYGWDRWFSSGCKHEKYVCPECGRKQCLLHWPYPMKTEEEAIHFQKSAELKTDKKCFVRHVRIGEFEKWKIFTSEEDYMSYIKTRQHKRKVISLTSRPPYSLPSPMSWKAWKESHPNTTHPLDKNPGDFWIINTHGFKGAHFAVYPEELLRRPILSSSRIGMLFLTRLSAAGPLRLWQGGWAGTFWVATSILSM